MAFPFRAAARLSLVLPTLAALIGASAIPPVLARPGPAKPSTAAPATVADTTPGDPFSPPYPQAWLYKGSDVPQDKAWVFGVLPNGLRYAVRNNGVPPGQVSIRILVDAGSLYETDDERGYAHLLEHLSFRESKYLKEGEAIPRWQQMGATFGSDTNAETGLTQTVYKLDLPEAGETKLDESMKLLSGMITAPIFTPQGRGHRTPHRSGGKARTRGRAAARGRCQPRNALCRAAHRQPRAHRHRCHAERGDGGQDPRLP